MTTRVTVVAEDAALDRAAAVARAGRDRLGAAGDATPRRRSRRSPTCTAAVTRRAVAGDAGAQEPAASAAANLAGRLGELGLDDVLRQVQAVAAERARRLPGRRRGARPPAGRAGFDIDIAVEGDGIAFAGDLSGSASGATCGRTRSSARRSWSHTATAARRQRVDVASTRSEFYDLPGSAAEGGARRHPQRSGAARLHDQRDGRVARSPRATATCSITTAGLTDLDARRIVVLHNLSFIEDPTRVLRAIRYENRYGLRMDAHTLNLARACCAMDLVGDLSSARLRDELIALLDEERVDFALRRMRSWASTPSIHAACGPTTPRSTSCAARDRERAAHALEAEVPRWRLRLMWLLRDLAPEEIAAWTERMRIRRRDADVLERARSSWAGVWSTA